MKKLSGLLLASASHHAHAGHALWAATPAGRTGFQPRLQPSAVPPRVPPLSNHITPSSFFSTSTVTPSTFLDPSSLSPSATLMEMKRFLRQKTLEFRESHSSLCVTLPKRILMSAAPSAVDATMPSALWKHLDAELTQVYLLKRTGGFICPEVGVAGDWRTLQSLLIVYNDNRGRKRTEAHLPYPPMPPIDLQTPPEVASTWSQCSPIEALTVQEFKNFLKHLRLPVRELKVEDFVRFEVRVNEDQTEMVFPVRYPGYDGPARLVGLRTVSWCPETGQPVENYTPESPLTSERNNDEARTRGLFPFPHGLDSAHTSGAKSVVIVASVLDSVALAAAGVNVCPVALAEGVSSLPPPHLPFFESFNSIAVWFPSDPSSFESARSFCRKLDEQRCRLMRRDVPPPLISLRKRESVSQALKTSLTPCASENITTFESLRDDVYLEMAHVEEIEGVKWKRFEGLNELTRGFRRGELTIFTGKTGTGKTTFMSEYSVDLGLQGVNTLWGSFEVKNVRLAKMQLKQFAGVNLEDNLDMFDHHADRFQRQLPMYYLTFHGSQDVTKVFDAMGHAVYMYDIAHIIIDNMQFMMGVSGRPAMDRFLQQDVIIQQFRKFATLHNVHVTLVIHPRKEDDERLTANSIFGGAKATQEADNVMLLQEEEINVKLKRKYIQIVKNRFSGDIGIMPLFFHKPTLTMSKKIFLRERKRAKAKETPTAEAADEEITQPS